MYADRRRAGEALAALVARTAAPGSIVAAIPRGGVAVAVEVARALGSPLEVVRTARLALPFAPDATFGALDEDGRALVEYSRVAGLRLTADEIEQAKAPAWQALERQGALYGAPPSIERFPGVPVVVVDDVMVSGLTMHTAVAYVRAQGASEVLVAVPCASTTACERLRREADALVCPIVDPDLSSPGAHYADFTPLGDEDVLRLLAPLTAPGRRPGAPGGGPGRPRSAGGG